MQKLSLYIILAILTTTAYTQQIDQITRFTYNHLVKDFDNYQGSIVGYEDRLFVTSIGRLQEFQVSPSGQLTQLSSIENGIYWDNAPLVDVENETLFCAYTKSMDYEVEEMMYLSKYDLSTVPMTHIATISAVSMYYSQSRLYMWGDYLLFLTESHIQRLNKHTFQFEEPIAVTLDPEMLWYSSGIYFHDNYMYLQMFSSVIYVYDLSLDEPFSESSYQIDISGYGRMRISDGNLYLIGNRVITIYDIADLENVTQIAYLDSGMDVNFLYMETTLYRDIYLIAVYQCSMSSLHNGLHIYDISDLENPVLVYNDNFDFSGGGNPIFVSGDNLYVSAFSHIGIYDLRHDFAKSRYGNYRWDFGIVSEYVIENPRYSNEVRIYSLFEDNPEIITITNSEMTADIYKIQNFQIQGDRLYVISYEMIEQTGEWFNHFLEIYEIQQGGNALQVGIFPLQEGFYPYIIKVLGDYILLSNVNTTKVYTYEDEWLTYLTDFAGFIETPSGYTSQQYFLNYTSNQQLEFRDVNDPSIVLDSIFVPHSMSYSYSLRNVGNNSVYIYSNPIGKFYGFDEQHTFTMTFDQSPVENLTIYNGIAALVDPTDKSTITFVAIENGVPREIGSENFGYLYPQIYVFPSEHKMVLLSRSGIHMYDIEYTLSESDVVSTPVGSVLYSNYPNPFNPSTTISFSLFAAGEVSIDIYNVRGQRVRSLVSGVYEAGVHSVVWNGCADDGVGVGSGVYFYRMVSGGFSGVKKMLLVK